MLGSFGCYQCNNEMKLSTIIAVIASFFSPKMTFLSTVSRISDTIIFFFLPTIVLCNSGQLGGREGAKYRPQLGRFEKSHGCGNKCGRGSH